MTDMLLIFCLLKQPSYWLFN